MIRTRTALTLILLVGCLGGCGAPKLMPTPVIFAETGIDPIAETPPVEGTKARVFYATDRTPRANPSNPAATYTNERDFGLRLGVINLDLAPEMGWDDLRVQSLKTRRQPNPRPRLVDVEEYGGLWTDIPPLEADAYEDEAVASRFIGEVERVFEETGTSEINIFVHGFNTKFANNSVIAAELHHYLGTEGVFMTYAWPSAGSLFAYTKDKASAMYSTRYFRLFLAFLAKQTSVSRINVIAHSAGAPVAVGAIREMCLMRFDESSESVRERYKLGTLLLVAPDMDLGVFENAVHDEIIGVPEHVAIYFSTRDRALNMSSWIFGFARLGEPLTELKESNLLFIQQHAAVELVDVVAAEKNHGSWLGHSYFHNDPWVSSDVLMLMHHQMSPAERGLVQMDGKPIWTFPKDYPDRATEVAREVYGTME